MLLALAPGTARAADAPSGLDVRDVRSDGASVAGRLPLECHHDAVTRHRQKLREDFSGVGLVLNEEILSEGRKFQWPRASKSRRPSVASQRDPAAHRGREDHVGRDLDGGVRDTEILGDVPNALEAQRQSRREGIAVQGGEFVRHGHADSFPPGLFCNNQSWPHL